jgi:hypothetical protein
MNIKAKIDSQEIAVKSGEKNGKPWQIREQSALVSFPNGEARRLALSLEANDLALPLGEYEPKDAAFYAGKFGIEVSMRARHWQPVAAVAIRKVG